MKAKDVNPSNFKVENVVFENDDFSIRFNQLVMVVGDGINTRLIECFTPIIGTIKIKELPHI